ncbi:MAG: hypothetical protein IKH59_09380 [Bacteroidaceae bacterium]|nr:hypothetical protein [Bacteroidaceae bacterium]
MLEYADEALNGGITWMLYTPMNLSSTSVRKYRAFFLKKQLFQKNKGEKRLVAQWNNLAAQWNDFTVQWNKTIAQGATLVE